MNWEAVGAVAELTGAVAVVLSLAYLAVQIRQNTRVARVSAHDSAVSSVRDISRIILEDPTMPGLLRRGFGQESLSADDEMKWGQFAYTFYKASENLHFHWRQGTIDDATFRGWESMIATYATLPAMEAYRESRRSFFPDGFHAWVDTLSAASAGEAPLPGLTRMVEGGGAGVAEST